MGAPGLTEDSLENPWLSLDDFPDNTAVVDVKVEVIIRTSGKKIGDNIIWESLFDQPEDGFVVAWRPFYDGRGRKKREG